MIAKLWAYLVQLTCTHVADYREVLELTVLHGERAARYRCTLCGASVWRYVGKSLTKTR